MLAISRLKNIVFFLSLMLVSCMTVARFDQYAYVQATSLKVDALALMDEGTEDYTAHKAEVYTLELKLLKAYEYERFRPKNEISAELWRILISPEGNLLGGYLTFWKKQEKCSIAYINSKKAQVSIAFEEIAALEGKKIK